MSHDLLSSNLALMLSQLTGEKREKRDLPLSLMCNCVAAVFVVREASARAREFQKTIFGLGIFYISYFYFFVLAMSYLIKNQHAKPWHNIDVAENKILEHWRTERRLCSTTHRQTHSHSRTRYKYIHIHCTICVRTKIIIMSSHLAGIGHARCEHEYEFFGVQFIW